MSDFESHDDEAQEDFPSLRLPRWYDRLTYWIPRPSHGASQEWMAYYKDMYHTHGPNRALFCHLLKRNGFQYLSNPFREGHPFHYSFCMDGVTLADVDFVLSFWQQKYLQGGRSHSSSPQGMDELVKAIETNWTTLYEYRPHKLPNVSLEMSAHSNHLHHQTEQQEWFDEATVILALLFLSPSDNWTWMASYLHKDNLGILCKIVYDSAASVQQAQLIEAWTHAQWLTPSQSQWLTSRSSGT